MGLRDRRKGATRCSADDFIVVFIGRADIGFVAIERPTETILVRDMVIGADDIVVFRANLTRSKITTILAPRSGPRCDAANGFAIEGAVDGEKSLARPASCCAETRTRSRGTGSCQTWWWR